ncbi:hypothetical protein [Leminorella grimontii]|nr:hypothetical protein [Leminorella grimontii]
MRILINEVDWSALGGCAVRRSVSDLKTWRIHQKIGLRHGK